MFDDYSLIKLRNRLAVEGEELVVHRFRSGMTKMVARLDFERWRRASTETEHSVVASESHKGVWQSIKNCCTDFLTYYGFIDADASSAEEPGPVVAIPSEALLRVFGLSSTWQEQYHLGSFEDALFIELSPSSGVSNQGLCFGNGVVIPLRLLHEGQRVKVLRSSWAESLEPDPELVQVKS